MRRFEAIEGRRGQLVAIIPIALVCNGMLNFAAKSQIWAKIARQLELKKICGRSAVATSATVSYYGFENTKTISEQRPEFEDSREINKIIDFVFFGDIK